MTGRRALRCRASPFVALLFTVAAATASAQDSSRFDPLAADAELEGYSQQLDEGNFDSGILSRARARAVTIAAAAAGCSIAAGTERERLEARFEPLRQIDAEVSGPVMDQFREIRNALDAAVRRQSSCSGVRDDAESLVDRITEIQTEISQQFLLHRTVSIVGLLRALPERMQQLPTVAREAMTLQPRAGLTAVDLLWILTVFGVVAAGLGLYLKHRFDGWFDAHGGDAAEPRLKFLFPKPLARFAPLTLEGLALVVVLYTGLENASPDMAIVRVAIAVLLIGLGWTAVDWITGPLSPAASIKGLFPDHVRPLRLRMRVFLVVLAASFVVLGTNWLSIRLVDPDVVGRATMIFLVAAALFSILRYLGKIPGLRHRFRLIRTLGLLALAGGVVCLLFGYQNLAGYLVHGVTRTALALIVLWVLLWLVFRGFEFLIETDTAGANRVRRGLGVRREGSRTGLGFMQLVADLVLWMSLVVYLIYVWDESGTTLDELLNRIRVGYTIGEVQLIPLDIIGGILVFAGVIVVLGWIKRWIDQRWLQYIVAERGAREAIITLIGYVGFVLASLIGLTMAGVNLGGLAIVSGALALGIGFGMQEIANNFVSGLILLFERPIRTGDFVTVGDVEGFVRRIRIRATEIETLDNQNVLVPNSELVSGRVTNWVLRNPQGRLLLRVGVAYGSNVERVKEILEQVASEHAEVITDGRAPAPRALFMGFGDSSLDFELRVRIQRIERRFSVLSDLNFAIDRAFREEGITIPFPQRDLHLVSYPDTAAPPEKKRSETAEGDDTIRTRIMRHPEQVTRSVREKKRLPVGIDEAWSAITDLDSLKQWLARDGEFRPFIGGPFELELRDDSAMSGRIDIFLPPRRMRLVLAPAEGEEPLASGPITIDFLLQELEADAKTELTVFVAGIPAIEDWEMDYRRTEDRWHNALVELKEYLRQK